VRTGDEVLPPVVRMERFVSKYFGPWCGGVFEICNAGREGGDFLSTHVWGGDAPNDG
jgi:hypothetical protein